MPESCLNSNNTAIIELPDDVDLEFTEIIEKGDLLKESDPEKSEEFNSHSISYQQFKLQPNEIKIVEELDLSSDKIRNQIKSLRLKLNENTEIKNKIIYKEDVQLKQLLEKYTESNNRPHCKVKCTINIQAKTEEVVISEPKGNDPDLLILCIFKSLLNNKKPKIEKNKGISDWNAKVYTLTFDLRDRDFLIDKLNHEEQLSPHTKRFLEII